MENSLQQSKMTRRPIPFIARLCAGLMLVALLILTITNQPGLSASRGGPIIIACDKSYPPFEFLNSDGVPDGIFIDYWRKWSKTTGIEVKFQCKDWNEALDDVRQGRADMVGALFATPSREQDFAFTTDFFELPTHVFFHKSLKPLRTVNDIREYTIGVQRGDAAESFLRNALPEARLRLYDSYHQMIHSALKGEIRVFVADTPVASFFLAREDAGHVFSHSDTPLYTSSIRAAVHKDNAALLATLNQGMSRIPRDHISNILVAWTDVLLEHKFPWIPAISAALLALLPLVLTSLWNYQLRRRVGRAVDELMESENKFQAVFDNTFQFSAILDTSGTIQEVNRAALDKSGQNPQELRGKPLWNVSWWSRNESAINRVKGAVDMAAQGEFIRYEVQHVNDSGEFLAVDFSLKPMRNPGGVITHLIAEARDITERTVAELKLQSYRDNLERLVEDRTRELSLTNAALQRENEERSKVEKALRESEEKHRLLLENAAEGIVVLQGNSLRYHNPAMMRLSGIMPEEVANRPFIDFVHPEDRARVAEYYMKRIRGEEAPSRYSFRLCNSMGEIIWVDNAAVTITWEGELASLSMLTDITQRKQVEETLLKAKRMAEDASRIMSDFVSVVSHELRTPMTSVLGFTKLIGKDFNKLLKARQGTPPDLQRRGERISRNLEIITLESERLIQLISDVLDLAKLEARKYSFTMESCSLEPLIRQTANVTSTFFMEGPVRLELDIQKDLPEVRCDKKSVIQVLVNLIANARKFTDSGEVRVMARTSDEEPGIIRISVQDTGSGIAPEDLEAIFEKYRQTRETLTDKPKGTGLGLAICREIVTQHGGTIHAESAPGMGSTFTFTLQTGEV